MSEMHESQLHAWLRYRDELSRRVTVADRVVRNVEALTLERPVRGIGRGRLLLVAAAVAAMLFAAIAVPHALLRSQPGDQYAPAGTPRGVPNRVPPTDVGLVWVSDPADTGRAIAFDHRLHPVGWLALGMELVGDPLRQSGDGQRLLMPDGPKGGTVEMTAQGRRIQLPPTRPDDPHASVAWHAAFSDDDRSVCIEEGAVGTPRTLVVADPSGHAVHTISEPPADDPSYLSWHVVTCSVRNNLAVFIGEPDPQPAHKVNVPLGQPNYIVRVVRLSTGAELVRRVYETSNPQPIDASTDGTKVLERNPGPDSYALREISTGALDAILDRNAGKMLDNRLAEVSRASTSRGPVEHSVVDILTGRTLWDEELPLEASIEDIGDGAFVLSVTHQGMAGICPTSAWIELTDLSTGFRVGSGLDTCPPRQRNP